MYHLDLFFNRVIIKINPLPLELEYRNVSPSFIFYNWVSLLKLYHF